MCALVTGAAGPDHDSDTRGVSDPLERRSGDRNAVEGGRSRPNCSLRRRFGGGTKRRLVCDLEVVTSSAAAVRRTRAPTPSRCADSLFARFLPRNQHVPPSCGDSSPRIKASRGGARRLERGVEHSVLRGVLPLFYLVASQGGGEPIASETVSSPVGPPREGFPGGSRLLRLACRGHRQEQPPPPSGPMGGGLRS